MTAYSVDSPSLSENCPESRTSAAPRGCSCGHEVYQQVSPECHHVVLSWRSLIPRLRGRLGSHVGNNRLVSRAAEAFVTSGHLAATNNGKTTSSTAVQNALGHTIDIKMFR